MRSVGARLESRKVQLTHGPKSRKLTLRSWSQQTNERRSQNCFDGWSLCWWLGWASSGSSSPRSRAPPRATAARQDRLHLVTGFARAMPRLAMSASHAVLHILDPARPYRSSGLESDLHLRTRRDLPIRFFCSRQFRCSTRPSFGPLSRNRPALILITLH